MADRQNLEAAVFDALDAVAEPADTAVLQHARRTKAVSMALAGLTYEQIGTELNISAKGAHELVTRTLEQTRNYAVDSLRMLENARLDRVQAVIWTKVLEGDPKAIASYLRIAERRAKMNGLDAPSKIAMSVSVRQEMERALSQLEEVVLDVEVLRDVTDADVVAEEARHALSHSYDEIVDPMDQP